MKRVGLVFLGAALGVFILAATATVATAPNTLVAAIGTLNASLLKWWQGNKFSLTRTPGDEGKDLLVIQQALATDASLTFVATPNGYFGEGTEAAIRGFQTEYQIPVTGVIDAATLTMLNQVFYNQLCPSPTTPTPDLSLAHVTREIGLPSEYVPSDLTNITGVVRTVGVQCVTRATAQALQQMFAAAHQDGIELAVTSGYRRPDIQKLTHDFWIATEGEARGTQGSALPYHSEHQTGTAVDLAGASQGFSSVSDGFGSTREGAWLVAHAHEFGFNQSYTGDVGSEYMVEPWHWRFVGVATATTLRSKGVSYLSWGLASAPPATTTVRRAPPDTVESVNELLTINGKIF